MSELNRGFPIVLRWSQEIRVETPEELSQLIDLLEGEHLVMPELQSDPEGMHQMAAQGASDWEYLHDVVVGTQETFKTSYTGAVPLVKQVCRYTRDVLKEVWRNNKTGQTKQTCLKYSTWELDQCIENPFNPFP